MNTPHTNHRNAHSIETDPRLDALLDRALSHQSIPGGLPEGCNERILAATRGQFGQLRQKAQGNPEVRHAAAGQCDGVLAKIGFHRLRWIAALLVLSAWTALWLVGGQIVKDAHQIAEVRTGLAQLDEFQLPEAPLDEAIDHLAQRINLTSADFTQGWDETHQSLEQAIAQWENDGANAGS